MSPLQFAIDFSGRLPATAQAGMQRADENADGRWKHVFDGCVLAAARKKPEITSDDVLAEIEALPNPPSTHNLAAIGPAMKRAADMGLLRASDKLKRSERPEARELAAGVAVAGVCMSQATKPHRIQRQRTKGWKMPANTVYVGRPTKWGNPFAINDIVTRKKCIRIYRAWIAGTFTERAIERICGQDVQCKPQPLAMFGYLIARGMLRKMAVTELRGKNLACWCPPDQPCHADILLEIANA